MAAFFLEKGNEMPRGKGLSDREREVIYTQSTLGESPEDIAQSRGLNPGTVRRVIREQRKYHEREREEMARSGKIVKKDGKGGKLMALPGDGFEFTHVTPDGRSHKKKVSGHLSKVAEQQYDKWCEELDSEFEFMSRVERKLGAVAEEVLEATLAPAVGQDEDDVVDIEPEPVPEINVRPWKEVAEERQREIDELRERLADYESGDWVSASIVRNLTVERDALIGRVKASEEAISNMTLYDHSTPVYLIWAKGEEPRAYGVFEHEEQALKKVDELNDVASFLGNGGTFQIEEVQWR